MTAEKLLAQYRATHPRSRAVRLVRYARNSGSVRQEQCILCGELGPTWCARWPQTKTAERWAVEHIADHLQACSCGSTAEPTTDGSWDGNPRCPDCGMH